MQCKASIISLVLQLFVKFLWLPTVYTVPFLFKFRLSTRSTSSLFVYFSCFWFGITPLFCLFFTKVNPFFVYSQKLISIVRTSYSEQRNFRWISALALVNEYFVITVYASVNCKKLLTRWQRDDGEWCIKPSNCCFFESRCNESSCRRVNLFVFLKSWIGLCFFLAPGWNIHTISFMHCK